MGGRGNLETANQPSLLPLDAGLPGFFTPSLCLLVQTPTTCSGCGAKREFVRTVTIFPFKRHFSFLFREWRILRPAASPDRVFARLGAVFPAANACCQPPDGSIKAEPRQPDPFHLLLFTFNCKLLFFIQLIQRGTLCLFFFCICICICAFRPA